MLRGAIGYFLGIFCCFLTVTNYIESSVTGEYGEFIVSIIISVVMFIVLMIWCHKHHIKMRNKHYEKLRGKFGW